MPSGGYGLNDEDREMLKQAFEYDAKGELHGLIFEWVWAYASARGEGATPWEASTAAYIEWDL